MRTLRAVFLWILCLTFPTRYSHSEDDDSTLLRSFVERKKSHYSLIPPCYFLRDAEYVIFRTASESPDLDRVAAALEKELDIPRKAAIPLIEGILLNSDADERRSIRRKPPEEQVRAIAAKFFQALDQAQENAAVVSALRGFSGSMGSFLPDLSEQILERVRRSQSPGKMALLLDNNFSDFVGKRALGIALEKSPDHPVLLEALASRSISPAGRAALYAAAMDRTTDAGAREYVARQCLKELLDAGLTQTSIEFFRKLSRSIRKSVRSGTEKRVTASIEGLTLERKSSDIRLELAAAYYLGGNRIKAHEVYRSIPASVSVGPTEDELKNAGFDYERMSNAAVAASRWRLLGDLLSENATDPFQQIVSYLGMDGFSIGAVGQVLWTRILGSYAEKHRYVGLAAHLSSGSAEELKMAASPGLVKEVVLSPAVEKRMGPISSEASRLRENLLSLSLRLRQSANSDPVLAQIDSTVSRLLSVQRLQPFKELSLPAGIVPVEVSEAEEAKRIARRHFSSPRVFGRSGRAARTRGCGNRRLSGLRSSR